MIEIKNLNYIYGRGTLEERHALKDINLTIPKNAVTAIIGHTGSGKSTLIEHLNGLKKPSSGNIFIDGKNINGIKPKVLRKTVGIVFQYPEYQLFEETVFDDIAFAPRNFGFDNIEACVNEAARLVGLNEDTLKKSPFELSGGQKRRAAIAGVLAMRPDILILDEPTAGLDPSGRDEILKLIKGLSDITVIFVSHSMEDVAKTADNIIVMNDGQVEITGTVNEVFSHSERLAEIGLNVPEITRIADKLRQYYDIPEGIYTVDKAVEVILKLRRA